MKYNINDRVLIKSIIYDVFGQVDQNYTNNFGNKIVKIDILMLGTNYPYETFINGRYYSFNDDDIVGKVIDDNKVVIK